MNKKKDIKGIFSPFLHPLLKPSAEKKTPTDLELDSLKSQLSFYLPDVLHLINSITKAEAKRFVLYRWKQVLSLLFITSLFVVASYLAVKRYIEPRIVHHQVVITDTVYRNNLKTFDELVKKISFRESSETYDIVSKHGMLGAFQFDPSTLKAIGINISKEEFLSNKELQVGALKLLFSKNRKAFQSYINRWNFRSIKGVNGTVTESGILMAFHLKPQEAKAFFDSEGKDVGKGDANGTKVSEYIEIFSGYEVP